MIVVSYAINEAKSYENGHRFDRRDEVHMDYALEFSHFVNTLGPRLCSREINVIHSTERARLLVRAFQLVIFQCYQIGF